MKAIVLDFPKHWQEERRRTGASRWDEVWEGVLHIPPILNTLDISSPNDESYEKLPFYAELGSLETWIIDRDTKRPEVFLLEVSGYRKQIPDANGWIRSQVVPVAMKDVDAKLWVQFDGDLEPSILPE
jgi:hypothetical protein